MLGEGGRPYSSLVIEISWIFATQHHVCILYMIPETGRGHFNPNLFAIFGVVMRKYFFYWER